jgi:CBS domain-containing protein
MITKKGAAPMKVMDILKKKDPNVWTIKAKQTIRETLGVLVEKKIGALVVMGDGDDIVGIVSERDMIRDCYQNSKNVETTQINQIMTRNVIVGTPEDDLDYIMGIMTQNRIRHLPIIAAGKLTGIISIGDIVKAQLQDTQYENRYLKDYIFGPRTP